MKPLRPAHHLAILLTLLPVTGPAARAADIAPVAAKLPAMLVGCRTIAVPVGDASQADEDGSGQDDAFEQERAAWMAEVQRSPIKRVGPLFVVMAIPPADHAGPTFPAEMCGRVDTRTTVSGVTIRTLPAKTGYAGYCDASDPETCLGSIYAALGFSDKRPWPRLPLYALWRNENPAPEGVADIVAYLASTPFDVTEGKPEEGAGQSFDIDGIEGCEGEDCGAFPEAIDVTDGRGIGWFLELSEAEKPKPVENDDSDIREGTDNDAPQ